MELGHVLKSLKRSTSFPGYFPENMTIEIMAANTASIDLGLRSEQIHIWQLNIPQMKGYLESWIPCLAPSERDRMNRFKFERDRTRFGLSQGGLRQLLGRYVQRDPATLDFKTEAKGKPYLCVDGQRSPLQFNLSHSGEWVVYALSSDRPVGIDIEAVRDLDRLEAMARHCLTPSEQADVEQLPTVEANLRFFEYWTCKEAYLKAIGAGLTVAMTEVEVIRSDTALTLKPTNPPTPQPWNLHPWQPESDYRGAIAYAGSPCQLRHHDLGAVINIEAKPL